MIELFRSKKHRSTSDSKREVERRLRQEVGLSRTQANHAVRIFWESRR